MFVIYFLVNMIMKIEYFLRENQLTAYAMINSYKYKVQRYYLQLFIILRREKEVDLCESPQIAGTSCN